MRRRMLIVAIALLVSGPAIPVCAKEPKIIKIIKTVETRAGEVMFLKLPGDPSVGYKWRLNKKLSKGLDLVEVDQLGWLVPKRRSFFYRAQSVQNIAVRAKAAGQANLAFDYYRRLDGQTYSRTSIVRVIIGPKFATW